LEKIKLEKKEGILSIPLAVVVVGTHWGIAGRIVARAGEVSCDMKTA